MSKEDKFKPENIEKLSVCDIMKNDTSDILKKMEFQMPIIFQNYSDLYTAYLHMFDDIFGTCYIAEKEFFDKLNIDQGILRQLKENSESIKNIYMENIENSTKFFDEYIKMRIGTIKSFDTWMHVMMETYAKILSEFNKKIN